MKKGTHFGRLCLCMVICMMLSGFLSANAQDIAKDNSTPNFKSSSRIRPLTIGDQVPDLEFQNVLNYKSKQVKLPVLKGVLVFIDRCSACYTACFSSFPEMMSRKEYST